ncbi:sigma-70 family RNA polymerase sigma factor [Chitinophagaceae bacterium LB-8]|uniref:Sigma-70 family RNA polymerase sigma factor n=1 Tax=Paraflavisolibacter caeni TaxID=2982496 RepID=A0A9X3B669_9BACT|nr:sigma-70 family RNA polymerase sigma factor [Paraflavisolibacter caeni]MCU7547580.1 sigma-70 family RNA polymerase sigma factor [Paraflavisolibacter caeni]
MDHLLKKIGISSDEEIIQRVLDGETALFEILIRRYNPILYKIARGYGFNHQDAEDLMQETHVTGFQQLQHFEHRATYKTWLSKILINKCLYKLKYGHFKYEVQNSDLISENVVPTFSRREQADLGKIIVNRELLNALEASLQQIPIHYRTVFVLREIEGFSVNETADLLDITPVNVKVRLNRAKAMLQKQLEQFYSSGDLYEFNLIYCTEIVNRVFACIQNSTSE